MPSAADEQRNWTDKSNKTGVWFTPEQILVPVRGFFGGQIPLDPATSPDNPTGARIFYTETTNGLLPRWHSVAEGVFLNPPYGAKHGFRDWLAKLHEEARAGCPIIALLPSGARSSTRYWQRDVLNPYVNAVCWIQGRVPFVDETGLARANNPYDSQLLGYRVDALAFVKWFGPLGKCWMVRALEAAQPVA